MSMKILGIDTVTHACSVALSGANDTIVERYKVEPKGHSDSLLNMLDELLDDVGISIKDLKYHTEGLFCFMGGEVNPLLILHSQNKNIDDN